MEDLIKILQENNEKREESFSDFACKSKDAIRFKPENLDIRGTFFRDIDRIIYSNSYNRYMDKTQVFSFEENDHITHRILHVQLVSKIGRQIRKST